MAFISCPFGNRGSRRNLSPHKPTARQAAPAIPSDARRSIFWYWFIASFVVVYVYLLLFVFEEEEG
jgi:hypothetical protein